MFQYISLGLLAITALIVLINLLKGLIRGLKKTIGSLAAIILSAIVAFIVTVIICNPSSSVMQILLDFVTDLIGTGELAEIFGIAAIGVAISYYVSMLLSPFVFLVLYILISIVVSIVVGIVIKFVPPYDEKYLERRARKQAKKIAKEQGVDPSEIQVEIPPHKKLHPAANRLGGLGVGIVCGLVVTMLVLMPVVGALSVVVEIGDSDAVELDGEFGQLVEDAKNDKVMSIYSASCGWIFDSLASANFEGEKVYLKKDIGVILAVLGNIGALAGETSEFGEEQIDALNNVVDSLDESPLLKNTLSGILSELACKWGAGESFLGVERIDAGELLNPLLDTILGVIATSTKDNIVEDMRTLTEMLEVFVKHDMLSSPDDYQAMLTTLGKEGVITELIVVANKNERMSVLSDQVTQLSIRALASTIGIPKNANERYDFLMSEIATVLNESYYMSEEEKYAYTRENVSKALDKYGVEAEGMALDHITDSIIADLGDKSNVTGEDVSEFFTIYAVANESSDAGLGFNGFDALAGKETTLVVNPDGTITVNGKVLKNYNANNYSESAAYKMGKDHADFGDADSLYSAGSMKSSLVTMDDILSHITKYSDCADPDAEAEKISDILSYALDIFGEGSDDIEKTELLTGVGELLDKMSNTEIFGSEVTGSILKAIFQTDSVKGELGLSTKEINSFADKLNDTAKSEHSSYTSTTKVVSSTIEVIDKINNTETTKEERRESTEKLMSDMTPENAGLLSTMTTPSMMIQYGSKEDTADVVSSSVSTLFKNMANFQSTTTASSGDDEYAREADAVNTILRLGMDSVDSDETSLFATEDSEGRTGYTADEYVDLLVSSQVVGDTLLTTVYEDGNDDNPFGIYPNDDDSQTLCDALTNYYNDNSAGLTEQEDELLKLKLNAVAIITNTDAPFVIG